MPMGERISPVRFAGEPLDVLRHSLAWPFVAPAVTLVLSCCSQLRRQVGRTQGAPPEPRVVRAVPRYVSERCKGHPAMPAGAGHLLGGSKKGRSDAVSCMVRVNADLLDMGTAVEHLQPDEAEGCILLVHGDQEPPVF